jgi:hypothetical protein
MNSLAERDGGCDARGVREVFRVVSTENVFYNYFYGM